MRRAWRAPFGIPGQKPTGGDGVWACNVSQSSRRLGLADARCLPYGHGRWMLLGSGSIQPWPAASSGRAMPRTCGYACMCLFLQRVVMQRVPVARRSSGDSIGTSDYTGGVVFGQPRSAEAGVDATRLPEHPSRFSPMSWRGTRRMVDGGLGLFVVDVAE